MFHFLHTAVMMS